MMKKLQFKLFSTLVLMFFGSTLSLNSYGQGEDCTNPIVVASLPYSETAASTCGMLDDYSASPCDASYMGGDDIVYTYTPVVNEFIDINLSNLSDSWTAIHILDACPDVATTCVGFASNTGNADYGVANVALTGGNTYYIVISTWPSPQCISSFDMDIVAGVAPPSGSTCTDPLVVATLPYTSTGENTSTYGDNYSGTGPCFTNSYLNGDEVVYTYTPLTNESVDVAVTNLTGTYAAVMILDDCPNGAPNCIGSASNLSSTADLNITGASLTAGTTYYIIVSTWASPQSTGYDISITAPTCIQPTALMASNITQNSADISWTGGSIANLEYGMSGFTQGSGMMMSTPNGMISLNNLMSGTTYDVYVENVCDNAPMIITGAYDGPLSGGTPKGVELYVTQDIFDLSQYGLGSANNGGGTDGVEFTFPNDTALAGTFIYVSSDSTGFHNFFGFAPDYTTFAMSINGDDAIELFLDSTAIDVFGDINVDGTGQTWDHVDGWAYRMNGMVASATFNDADWTYSGTDAFDGETSNSTAATPFPLASYTGPMATESGASMISFTTACQDSIPGDSMQYAIPVMSFPYMDAGNTADPCYTSATGNASNDVYYEVINNELCEILLDATLCNNTTYDSYLRIYDPQGNQIAFNDDACGTQSEILGTAIAAGDTVYVIVEGYSASNGNYELNLTATGNSDATFTYPAAEVCTYESNPVATITDPNGTFSSVSGMVTFADASTGEIDLMSTMGGSYDVIYQIDTVGGVCYAADTVAITLTSADAGTSGSLSVCDDESAVDLFSGLGGTPDMTGVFGDNDNTGALTGSDFDATATGTGTFDFDYIVTNSICADTSTVTVSVDTTPSAGLGMTDTACNTDNMVDLTTYLDGTQDAGGVFMDDDATGAVTGSMFDATAAGTGSYNFTYVVTNNGCSDSTTLTVIVENCVGISEFSAIDFEIFPNPSKGNFTISSQTAGELTVRVIDARGRVVYDRSFVNNNVQNIQVELGDVESGMYTVSFISGNTQGQRNIIVE